MPGEPQILREGGDLRIILPARPATAARFVGCAPMLFGILFSGFALFWMIGASGVFAGPPPGGIGDWLFRILFVLFGVPFFIAGLFPFFVGVWMILPGHAEIALAGRGLKAVERAGFLRWSRRRPLEKIGALRVKAPPGDDEHGVVGSAIVVECQGMKDLPIATRYDQSMLSQVAQVLSKEIAERRAAITIGPVEAAGSVAVVVDEAPSAEEPSTPRVEQVPPQPLNSNAILAATEDTLTIVLPPSGFRGAARFFLTFSIMWNLITFGVAAGFVRGFIEKPGWAALAPLGFIMIFVAVGVGMALAAVQTAFRKAVILATRQSLVVTQRGPIRATERQWNPTELAAIRVGKSGTEINDRPVMELQFHDTGGKKHGFFGGRDEVELQWIAAQLRSFHGVKRDAGTS